MSTIVGAVSLSGHRYRCAVIDADGVLRSLSTCSLENWLTRERLAARRVVGVLPSVSTPLNGISAAPGSALPQCVADGELFMPYADSFVHDAFAEDFERSALTLVSFDAAVAALVMRCAESHPDTFWAAAGIGNDLHRLTLVIDGAVIAGFSLPYGALGTIGALQASLAAHCRALHVHHEIPSSLYTLQTTLSAASETAVALPIFHGKELGRDDLLAWGAALAGSGCASSRYFSCRSMQSRSIQTVRRMRFVSAVLLVFSLAVFLGGRSLYRYEYSRMCAVQARADALAVSLDAEHILSHADTIAAAVTAGTTSQGRIRWSELLQHQVQERPEGLYLSRMGTESNGQGAVLVEGWASTDRSVTAFVSQLQKSGRFAEVAPAMLSADQSDSSLTRFAIRCRSR